MARPGGTTSATQGSEFDPPVLGLPAASVKDVANMQPDPNLEGALQITPADVREQLHT